MVRPVLGWQQAAGHPGSAREQVVDNGLSVNGHGERPAHTLVGEGRVVEVEPEVLETVGGRPPDFEMAGVLFEPAHGVGIERVLHQVHRAVLQLERAHGLVGDHPELYALYGRVPVGVVGVGFEQYAVSVTNFDQAVGASADQLLARQVALSRQVGRQHGEACRLQESGVGLRELEHYLVGPRLFNRLHRSEHGLTRRPQVWIHQRPVTGHYVVGGNGSSVMENEVRAQLEPPRQRVDRLPA